MKAILIVVALMLATTFFTAATAEAQDGKPTQQQMNEAAFRLDAHAACIQRTEPDETDLSRLPTHT